MDPGATSVQVTVCESSTSFQIKKFGVPGDNVIKFWKASPNGVSSPRLTVICPAVVGDTLVPVLGLCPLPLGSLYCALCAFGLVVG